MITHKLKYLVPVNPTQDQGTAVRLGRWMTLALLAAMLVMAGCHKGDPGPAGPNGANGTDGTNGTNGKNGAGYNEATRKGSITTYLDGKTPAGDTFRDTLNFKFSSNDLYASSIYYYNSNDYVFRLTRSTSLDNYTIQNNLQFYFEVYNDGVGDTSYYIDHYLQATVATIDFKYFKLNDDYYAGEGSNITNVAIEGLFFDTSSGHLYYRYSWIAPANSNSTGYDLNVSGVVDATVYVAD